MTPRLPFSKLTTRFPILHVCATDSTLWLLTPTSTKRDRPAIPLGDVASIRKLLLVEKTVVHHNESIKLQRK
jgi:hypothetical protein